MDEEDLEKYEDESGEEKEEYLSQESSSSSSQYETCVLTRLEAGDCLHNLGKCDSGLGYAYLSLSVSNKNLTDIRVIPTFKYVIYLDVSGNKLTLEALQVLSSMTYLLMLQADRNLLSSAELKPMPYLQVLTLNGNKITCTSGISHKLLECLELNHNNIDTVTLNPYDLKNLKILELRGNVLTTTDGIFFPTLTRLYLADNRITKLEDLGTLVNLQVLHLRGNKISDLSGFDSRCKKLNYLNIRNNKIMKISELEKLECLSGLKTLIVLENPVTSVKEEEEVAYRRKILAMLPNLKRIDKDLVLYDEREEAAKLRRQIILHGGKFSDLDYYHLDE